MLQTINEIPFDLRRQKMPQQMIVKQTAKPTSDTATIASTEIAASHTNHNNSSTALLCIWENVIGLQVKYKQV